MYKSIHVVFIHVVFIHVVFIHVVFIHVVLVDDWCTFYVYLCPWVLRHYGIGYYGSITVLRYWCYGITVVLRYYGLGYYGIGYSIVNLNCLQQER